MDDFLHGDLHAIVDYLLFRPIFRALLQGPRSGRVTFLFLFHIPSCSAGTSRRVYKDAGFVLEVCVGVSTFITYDLLLISEPQFHHLKYENDILL